MKTKLFFILSFLTLLFLSGSINAQSMIFSPGVGSDCAPTETGSSFALGKSGTEVYAIVDLTTEISESTSVKFEVYKDGEYDFSTTIDLPAKTNCFWEKLIFYKLAAWTITAVDANGNTIASGTVNITSN